MEREGARMNPITKVTIEMEQQLTFNIMDDIIFGNEAGSPERRAYYIGNWPREVTVSVYRDRSFETWTSFNVPPEEFDKISKMWESDDMETIVQKGEPGTGANSEEYVHTINGYKFRLTSIKFTDERNETGN